jgi:hypothetical protein
MDSEFSIASPSRIFSSEVYSSIETNSLLEIEGGISMAELLYRTNMIALVGTGSNPAWPVNKVLIWDDSKLDVVGELTFKSIVRGLKMVKDK